MNQYTTLQDLKADFISGDFELTEEVQIDGKIYRPRTSTSHPFVNMLSSGHKGAIVYESESAGWLLFLWGTHKNSMIPYDVRTTTLPIMEKEAIEDRIIPDKVEVHFLNLPISGSVVAKVDTGAEMCSLHAEQVQINRGERTVSFVCPHLSRSKLTVPLVDQQTIKTSGGDTTYRAVIQPSLKIKGKILKDIQVNLNDRGEMDEPMLVGQNALQDGNFLIDPNIIKEASELLTEEFLKELQKDIVVPPTQKLNEETAQKIYEAMTEVGDISVADLMTLLRTQVLKHLDEISY
jgi:hypothetical protein